MKIAVTDACIFIDILDLKLIRHFFALPLEIHTTVDVLNELYENQEETLRVYESVGKLVVHNLTSEDRTEILNTDYPKSLSMADKSVLLIAVKAQAIVLSSDKAVRKYARNQAIEYHGVLWVISQLVELEILSCNAGKDFLEKLLQQNMVYRSNQEVSLEFEKLIKKWSC